MTLTLAAAVAHDDVVTVSYEKPSTDDSNRLEDADGNETASFSDQAVTNDTPDTEAPAFVSATVNGTELIITFDEVLAAAPNLANDAFTVKVDGTAVDLSGTPVINWARLFGPTVTLTLAAAVAHDDTVTVSYEKPATDDSNNKLEDTDGNETASFTDAAVTNNTPGVTLSLPALSVNEGGTASYSVKLAVQPSNTVTVTIGGMTGTDVTVGDTTLEFTTTDWNTAQTVTVTAAHDADNIDDEVTLTHTPSGGGYDDVAIDSVAVTVLDDEATGAPAISGTAEVGETLTAGQGDIADRNGLPATFPDDYTFQWVREDSDGSNPADIAGATSQTYTLVAADEGKKVRVEVSFTDGAGNAEGPLASEAWPGTGTIAPAANTPATGKPAISGAAEVGETLTAGQGDIADDDGLPATFPDDYSFQWHRVDADGSSNRSAISGATSATYTLAAADEGRKVIVAVSFTDDLGNAETLESDAYPSVDTVTAADTTAPAFSSAAVNGTALVITFDEALAAAANLANDAFTVRRSPLDGGSGENVSLSGAPTISGATVTLTLAAAVAHDDTVTVSYTRPATDDSNRLEDTPGNETASFTDAAVTNNTPGVILSRTALSVNEGGTASYSVKLAVQPSNTVTVTIGGMTSTDVTVGDTTLEFTTTDWNTAQTVTVMAGHDADNIDDEVTLTHMPSGGGYDDVAIDSVAVTVRDDEATGAPAISGTAEVGETLTAGQGDIADRNGLPATFPDDYTFQWVREDSDGSNPADIAGATSQTYTLVAADEGKKVRVEVSFTDGAGNAEGPLASEAWPGTGTIAPAANTPATGKPAISGTAEVGETLTAGQGDIADDDGLPATFPDDYSFQWHRVDADGSSNRSAISGATSATYTLTAADEGRKVIVAVSFTDDAGNAEGPLPSDAYPSVGTVTVADTTAPAFASAAVNGTALVITFDEALATAANLANSAFTVKVGGSTVTLGGTPSISGMTVTLTLAAAVAHDDTVTVSYTRPATDNSNRLEDAAGNETASFTDAAVDNNTPGVTLSLTALPVDEGGSNTYTVALETQPSNRVTVTIGGMTGTDVTVDDTTLDFTTTDWNTAQTVTVTAAQDADAVDDEVTLTHTASGGGYDGVAIDNVVVTVADTTLPDDPHRCDESPGTVQLAGDDDRETHEGRYIEGRLEICAVHPDRGAVWGTVCDDRWTTDDAHVACRGLGFPHGSVSGGEEFLDSHFGPGTLDILLDDMLCAGDEGSLLECPTSRGRARKQVGRHNCNLTETVGVRCHTEAAILSVADAEAHEGTDDASLEFTVRLNRKVAQDVTVDYTTVDGTAKAGEDYSAHYGTLRFTSGETEKLVRVRVKDDYTDEGAETLDLVLSNASGADFPGGAATLTAKGTIINTDPMPRGWLARFGRTSATQVTDMLGARFDAAVAPPSQLTLGGRRIRLPSGQAGRERPEPAQTGTGGEDRETAANAENTQNTGNTGNTENTGNTGNTEDTASFDRLSGSGERERVDSADVRSADGRHLSPVRPADAVEDVSGTVAGGARHPNLIERAAWALLTKRESLWAAVDQRRFLSRSSFNLSLSRQGSDGHEDGSEMQPPGRWSLWGRGALTQFGGRDGEVGIDGNVLTGLMGLDYAAGRWLAGMALSWSDGDGRYRSDVDSGDVDSHLAGVYPYGRYALNDNLSVWGVAGYGLGEMRLQQTRDGKPAGEALKTGINLGMGATGLKGIVYASEATELAVKSDFLLVRTTSEAVEGMAGVDAAAASRLRLLLSGRHQRALADDALLTPDFELGLRYDGGAAETGFGLELGGGLRYADPLLGLTLETRARGLLTHEDGGYEEWGLSGSVQVDPGRAGRGLMLRLASGWGRTASGTQALWDSQGVRGLAPQQGGAPGGRFSAELELWAGAAVAARAVDAVRRG